MAAGGRRSTKLAADAMLGSMARKLRAFGFDTTYMKAKSDSAVLSSCSRQKRVLLTADRELAFSAGKRGVNAILVSGETDRARLKVMLGVAAKMGLRLTRGEPRCSTCNGSLIKLNPPGVRGRVPDSVYRRHRIFFKCRDCGQIYWKGGHWKKLRRLEKLFDAKS